MTPFPMSELYEETKRFYLKVLNLEGELIRSLQLDYYEEACAKYLEHEFCPRRAPASEYEATEFSCKKDGTEVIIKFNRRNASPSTCARIKLILPFESVEQSIFVWTKDKSWKARIA